MQKLRDGVVHLLILGYQRFNLLFKKEFVEGRNGSDRHKKAVEVRTSTAVLSFFLSAQITSELRYQ